VQQIKHGPRHSYASYLLARDQSVDALLLNMGHEDGSTLFKHYHRATSHRTAKTFWSIRPPTSEAGRKIVAMAAR
jgi:integrase